MNNEYNEPLSIALSGGGHRASLFVLGAMLALVDRKLNKNVKQISSVSGGSIINGIIAQRCEFDNLEPTELDSIATSVVQQIVSKGVLPTRIIFAVLALMTVIAVSAFFLINMWVSISVAVLFAIALFCSAFLFTGQFIEWRILKAFFTNTHNSQMLGKLARNVEHVFCTTDLVAGRPVYFSTSNGGKMYRQLGEDNIFSTRSEKYGKLYFASDLNLSSIVRASAAFPGIPPRRTVFNERQLVSENQKLTFGGILSYPDSDSEKKAHLICNEVGFLADGGIVNNLGNQVLREDGFYQGVANNGELPKNLLCVDASAGIASVSNWYFQIPGVSTLMWFVRSLHVLSENSVRPRKDNISHAINRRSIAMQGSTWYDTLDCVVDMSDTDSVQLTMEMLSKDRDRIRKIDPEVRKWKYSVVDYVTKYFVSHGGRHLEGDKNNFIEELSDLVKRRPTGKSSAEGMLDQDAVEDMVGFGYWNDLVHISEGDIDAPTTLGTISPCMARRLVVRGYLNTLLMSLLYKPLNHGQGEGKVIASFVERINIICPS